MSNQKNGFWRRFTWQRMIKFFCWLFILTLIVEILFDLSNWKHYFTLNQLLSRFIKSVLLGFVFSIWHEPGGNNHK